MVAWQFTSRFSNHESSLRMAHGKVESSEEEEEHNIEDVYINNLTI